MHRILIYGNSGSGKTMMAGKLARDHGLAHLDLDSLAWQAKLVRRPLLDSIGMLHEFIESHATWVIEGCYADLIEAALPYCTELRFLNPDVEACVANCRRRPWEPTKYASPEEQDERLDALIAWVRQYETRQDEYSLARHRALFDRHPGSKREYDLDSLGQDQSGDRDVKPSALVTVFHDVVVLEEQALRRWLNGDPGGFLELCAEDVVYFDPCLERRIDGLAALTAYYEALRGKIRAERFELLNPLVQEAGDAATLTFNFVSFDAKENPTRWNCTEVYRRQGSAWKLIQSHWSFTKGGRGS